MKTMLIFLTLFTLSSPLLFNGQEKSKEQKELVNNLPLYNLFYLSKYLDNPYLQPEQKNAVNAQFINLLGTEKLKMLQNYTGNDFDKLKNYLKILNINSPARLEFIYDLKKEDYEAFKNKYTINDSFQKKLNSIINKRDSLKKLIEKKVEISVEFNNEKEKQTNIFSLQTTDKEKDSLRNLLNISKVKFDLIIKTIDEKITNESKSLENEIESFSNAYVKEFPTNSKQTNNLSYLSAYYTENNVGQNLQITNNYVQSLQNQGTSSFNIPSESQLIDAMAIFLAKRAKQEAAIWFMDQIRDQLNNPLINTTFPNTIKLITSLEDYKVPNFGVEWRYAISKDFVTMPKSIVDSKWMELKVNDSAKLKEIKTTIEFGSKLNILLAENYNYRDIIKSLYLDELRNNTSYIKPESITSYLNKNITLLYMFTNEFYSIDNTSTVPTYRLLTFEELNSLNNDQWEFLVELIHLKYFYNNSAIAESPFKKQFNNVKLCKKEAHIFISSLLLNLSQFDKIRKNLANTSSAEKVDYIKQNYNTSWKVITQILDNLTKTKFLEGYDTTKDNVQYYVNNLKKSIAIYENIQSRNYRTAVQNTMDFINNFNDQNPKNPVNKQMINFTKSSNLYCFILKDKQLLIENVEGKIRLQNSLKIGDKFDEKLSFITLDYNDGNLNDIWAIIKNDKITAKKFEKSLQLNSKKYKKLLNHYDISTEDLLNLVDVAFINKEKEGTIEIKYLLQGKQIAENYLSNYDSKYANQLLKLTSFFGDVLTTTDSVQLSDVISSYALPATSYKLKRRMKFSIDLNAYVGAYGGYKFKSDNSTFENDWTGGITAPIGITVTDFFGQCKNSTYGISFNFIDLGNIVNHYLTSTEKYYKDVHFSEVFSPNVNFLWSIPRSPFVAFVGVSFLPLKSTEVGGITKNNRAFDLTTIQAGIKIDIPLINLYSKEK